MSYESMVVAVFEFLLKFQLNRILVSGNSFSVRKNTNSAETNSRWKKMLLGKFLDPKNDIAFKKIFGTEKK